MWTDYQVKDQVPNRETYSDIIRDTIQLEESIINRDRKREQLLLSEEKRAYNNYAENVQRAQLQEAAYNESIAERNRRAEQSMVTECLYKLYCESYVAPMDSRAKTIGKNLIANFVQEQGAHKLIRDWHHKNMILSEFSRICEKHLNKLLEEEIERDENGFPITKDFKIDSEPVTDFFQDIQDIDYTDASKMIHDRVSDAITDFMDENISTKMDYQDIIDSAKDQIDSVTEESAIQSIKENTERQISDIESNREKNVFHVMVESLAKKSYKDEGLKQRYINENASLDMESITDSVQAIYTFIEMCNTVNIVNMNEKAISDYLANL